MNLFEELFFNILLLIFPILIYFIYRCYASMSNNKYMSFSLGLALFTSLYFTLKYGTADTNDKILLFCNIPIVLSYINRKGYIAILLSLLVILYCYFIFEYNIYIMLIKYTLYMITYYYYLKSKRINEIYFLAIISVIQGFFISFEYFFINTFDNVMVIINIFLMVLFFYIITIILLYLLKMANKITCLYSDLKVLEKEKQIKDSLFKITHEVKNPIAVCKGYLDMLDTNNQDKVNRYIPIIREEIDRSLNIMTDFMELNKIKIEKEIIDINLLLDDVYDSFKLLNTLRNIKLEYFENEKEIYVEGDYNRLKQVFLNILKNSSEAIKNDGNIVIKSKLLKNKYNIYIIDNGIGMDKETLLKIKDLFYTTKSKGSGIGVSLSNEIIKAHNGTLEYSSILNKGTTVTISLPVMKNVC